MNWCLVEEFVVSLRNIKKTQLCLVLVYGDSAHVAVYDKGWQNSLLKTQVCPHTGQVGLLDIVNWVEEGTCWHEGDSVGCPGLRPGCTH